MCSDRCAQYAGVFQIATIMKYVFLSLVCFSLLTSCQDEQAPMPKDTIANMLTDLHMAEAYAQLIPKDLGGYMTKNMDTLAILKAHIYKKYEVDTTSFNEALLWYKQRPKVFDQVYEMVLNKLSVRKETYKDSISEYTDSTEIEIKDTLKE